MEGKEVREQTNSIVRSFLDSGDFRTYMDQMVQLMTGSPREFWADAFNITVRNLDAMGGWISKAPEEGKGYALVVAAAFSSLYGRAHARMGKRYAEYMESAGEVFQFDIEAAARVFRLPHFGLPLPGMVNVEDSIQVLLDLLSSYQRRIAYLVGLTDLCAGKVPDLKALVLESPRALERRLLDLRDEPWTGLVLGAEYNHLRNAIAHRSYRILRGPRALRFWDGNRRTKTYWERRYDYTEFAAMQIHAAIWGAGWMIGRTLEQAELTALVYAGVLAGVSPLNTSADG